MKWTEKSTYSENNKSVSHYEFKVGGFVATVHQRPGYTGRWYLTVGDTPLNFQRSPLVEMDIEDAKKEAIDKLLNESIIIQNDLHIAARKDTKVIETFKLRLVAILNEAENLENAFLAEEGMDFEKLIGTIKDSMSDLV